MFKEIVDAIRRIHALEKDTTLWCVVGYGLVRLPNNVQIENVVLK